MGYTTEFYGSFKLDKPLTRAHEKYLRAFAESRRMKRNAGLVTLMTDPVRLSVGLPVGIDGGYYVGGADNDYGQARSDDIIEYNNPPEGQPGLWCKWVPTEDGQGIEWSGAEKFYEYTEWLEYLVEHFLKPWGYVLSGEVKWNGESAGDLGVIVVQNNLVTARKAKIEY